MSIVNLLAEIRADLQTLPGVVRVHENVPDSLSEFPAVVVATFGGRCALASHGSGNGIAPLHCEHDVRVEIHIPRTDLASNAATMTGIAEDAVVWLYSGFARDRYNGTMVTPAGGTPALTYEIGGSQWGGQNTYMMGCDFRITTEEKTTG